MDKTEVQKNLKLLSEKYPNIRFSAYYHKDEFSIKVRLKGMEQGDIRDCLNDPLLNMGNS